MLRQKKFTDVIIEQYESFHESFTEFMSAGEESFFPCTICDKTFSTSNKLKVHKYQYHCSEEDRKCKFCDKVLNTRYALTKHMKTIHGSNSANVVKFGTNQENLFMI